MSGDLVIHLGIGKGQKSSGCCCVEAKISKMALREFWILVGFFLVALRRALTVAWIRLNKFMSCSDRMVRPVSDFRHKVCLYSIGSRITVDDPQDPIAALTSCMEMYVQSRRKTVMVFIVLSSRVPIMVEL